jgi:hypothetical protein
MSHLLSGRGGLGSHELVGDIGHKSSTKSVLERKALIVLEAPRAPEPMVRAPSMDLRAISSTPVTART